MLLHRFGLSVWVLTDTKTGDLLAGAGPTRFTPKYKDIRGGGRTLRDIKGTGDGAAGAGDGVTGAGDGTTGVGDGGVVGERAGTEGRAGIEERAGTGAGRGAGERAGTGAGRGAGERAGTEGD